MPQKGAQTFSKIWVSIKPELSPLDRVLGACLHLPVVSTLLHLADNIIDPKVIAVSLFIASFIYLVFFTTAALLGTSASGAELFFSIIVGLFSSIILKILKRSIFS